MGSYPVHIVRHGSTDLNGRAVLQGKQPAPLNPLGVAQIRQAAMVMRRLGVRAPFLLSSPLPRALESARLLTHELGGSEPESDDRLRERDFGRYEGLSREAISDLREERALRGSNIWLDWEGDSNVEPERALGVRAQVAVRDALNRAKTRPLLVITHAGTIRALLGVLLNDSRAAQRLYVGCGGFVRLWQEEPNTDYTIEYLHNPVAEESP